ncbi:MAG TPA: YggT family protein [Rhizomicrobium sp.]|nr:YggT family protein [Rhizomicrobium sp.]
MYITPMGPAYLLVTVLTYILEIYKWIVIAAVIASWLVAFNVINLYNHFVRSIVRFLDALTDPAFRFVRRFLPPIGGLDLSPIVVFLAIWVVEDFVVPWLGVLVYQLVG